MVFRLCTQEILKTNHVQLKSRISCQLVVYSECVLEGGDSSCGRPKADILTSATDQSMRNAKDILREAGIHRTNVKSQTNVLFCQKEY